MSLDELLQKIQFSIKQTISDKKIGEIDFYDVCDEWLEKRLIKACTSFNIRLTKHDTLSFINNRDDLSVFFKEKKKYFPFKP